MRALSRGEVIIAQQPDGKGGLKSRHMVVYRDSQKDDTVVSVYCTKQNDGLDHQNLFVPCDSEEGENMGLWEDTYIRCTTIVFLPAHYILRPVGNCSLIDQIDKINDDNMAKR